MGKLYVVATPIGNLGDMTVRGMETLRTVDLITAEDTRHTKKLLDHYQITTPMVSFHQHSRLNKIDYLIAELLTGKNLALVTDAGTPGIQDPAGVLVQAARTAGIEVVAIPGPSALTAALSIAGVSADSFIFLGFLPKKKGRETLFKKVKDANWPLLIYESPMRVGKTLRDIEKHLGVRQLIIFRELTKKFEEVLTGDSSQLLEHFVKKPPKGEFVIMILPAQGEASPLRREASRTKNNYGAD